jgi:hypothetical protein
MPSNRRRDHDETSLDLGRAGVPQQPAEALLAEFEVPGFALTAHPDVIYAVTPFIVPRYLSGSRLAVLPVIVFIAVIGVGAWFGLSGTLAIVLAVVTVMWIGLVGLVMIAVTKRRNRRLRVATTDEDGEGFSALLQDFEGEMAVAFNAGWTWAGFETVRRARGLRRPTAIVDGCLRATLDRVGLHAELLEPEMIDSSPGIAPRRAIVLVLLFSFNAISALTRGAWTLAGISAVPVLLFAAQIPQVRRLLPRVRAIDRAPVAGAGFLEDARGRRWTVSDSVMIVFARRAVGPLVVMLLGPAGKKTLTFTTPDDEHFVALWQRWCHPSPRLELLETP